MNRTSHGSERVSIELSVFSSNSLLVSGKLYLLRLPQHLAQLATQHVGCHHLGIAHSIHIQKFDTLLSRCNGL